MVTISTYLKNFNFSEAQSIKAIGVGAFCYIGLKAFQYEHKLTHYAGKGALMASTIAIIYFAGFLNKESYLSKCIGFGIPIPGLGGAKLGFGISEINSLVNNISHILQPLNCWNRFFQTEAPK